MGHSILKSYYYTSLQSQAWNYIFLAVKKSQKFPRESSKSSFAEHMLWVFGVHSLVFSHKKILGNYKSFFEVQAWLRNLNKSAMKSGKSTCNFLYDTTHSQEHNIMHELYIFHKHKKHTFGILESSFQLLLLDYYFFPYNSRNCRWFQMHFYLATFAASCSAFLKAPLKQNCWNF